MASRIAFPLTVLLLGACRSAEPGPRSGKELVLEPASAPAPAFTRAFEQPAVLVADEITIEGPPDLIEHLALRQDDETLYSTKTVPSGLQQELAPRPGSRREVHGQLDAWSLAALRKITVLQRPGEVPVTVRAVGQAYWARADGSEEQRQAVLVFQGTRGR